MNYKIDYHNCTSDDLLQLKAINQFWPIFMEAVDKDIFTLIGEEQSLETLQEILNLDCEGITLFLEIMEKLGLITSNQGYWCNAPITNKYLVSTSSYYNPYILNPDNNIKSFDGDKLINYIEHIPGKIAILPFLAKELGKEFLKFVHIKRKEEVILLEEIDEFFHGIILAGFNDLCQVEHLNNKTLLGIIGCYSNKNSLYVSIRRYMSYRNNNGESFNSYENIIEKLPNNLWHTSPLLTLTEDLSVVFTSKDGLILNKIPFSLKERVRFKLQELPIRSIKDISPKDVVVADWVVDKCRYGCSSYGDGCCPPNSPTYEDTYKGLESYSQAFLIEGEPPTRDFQLLMLEIEKIAFLEGFYKSFVLWAGPCSLCDECKPPKPQKKCTATRPSMEGSGIDVFETVKRQGHTLNTLRDRNEYVKYFGLLLLE